MTRTNRLVEVLKLGPCTIDDLPYRPSSIRFPPKYHTIFQKIHVIGRKNMRGGNGQYGHFRTIYYFSDHLDDAIALFVTVNYGTLGNMDFTKNTFLHHSLPKGMAAKIITEFKSRS